MMLSKCIKSSMWFMTLPMVANVMRLMSLVLSDAEYTEQSNTP